MYGCLKNEKDFLLEAGAGAGKTYSLIKALQYLIESKQSELLRKNQQIACITFTNVAKEEIRLRTDRNSLIYCDTTHAFCWSLINGFQSILRKLVGELPEWKDKLEEVGGVGRRSIDYILGHRTIEDDSLMLHHDDVIPLTVNLMQEAKFRHLLTSIFPIILIDEYQDTNKEWIETIKSHFLGKPNSPLFGFFGDHWQKIYGDGCGSITHPELTIIGKEANFRSVKPIVDCLNKMRPELPQKVKDESIPGQLKVFHTNSWPVSRQTGPHWGGDLPTEEAHLALEKVKNNLEKDDWDFSSQDTKILMLTHRVLAYEQGYSSLPGIFRYNDSFAKKQNAHIEYFVDILEPTFEAYANKKFGLMFESLGRSVPTIQNISDKTRWSTVMDKLATLRMTATVGEVIDYLRETKIPRLSSNIERREIELENFNSEDDIEMPASLGELKSFRDVPYTEVIALRKYLIGYSPFETKHGVKGAEFENVLVVIGRGWNVYNFSQMLELANTKIPNNKVDFYERNRNLFYVACSRPKIRLAVLFTQELSAPALNTLNQWFGHENIESLSA